MRIDVIQYVRPSGRQRDVYIEDMPDDLQPQIAAIKSNGLRVAVEELATGDVSFTLEHSFGDFDIELCENGPGENGTRVSLEKLIRRFEEKKFLEWLMELQHG